MVTSNNNLKEHNLQLNKKISTYVVKTSKSGHNIPVINDIHLHSAYNPIREAESFIENNTSLILSRPNLLILGLGFGYHVNLANKILSESSFSSFQITVIEPLKKTYNNCSNLNLLDHKNVIVYAGQSVEELYSNTDFTNFLLKAPTILAHPASFNFYNDYFKNMLGYHASQDMNQTCGKISNEELKDFLAKHSNFENLDHLASYIQAKKHPLDNKFDHLLLAFQNMTRDTL